MMILSRLPQVVSAACGSGLALATAGLAAARKSAKPLHPRGEVWEGVLTRTGVLGTPTGVAWLDESGSEEVLVRLSAAIGLPDGRLDIQGLALKLPSHDGADLLFATTGAGPLTRFVLRPAFVAPGSGFTTLLPVPSPAGPVFLRATGGEGTYTLAYAVGLGPWVRFASLELGERSSLEPSFDPVSSPHPELGNYTWVTRLRAPAYRTARASRGESREGSSVV